MNFVWWLVSVLATCTAVRFVWLIFRRITSKENMQNMLDMANAGMRNTANRIAYGMQERSKKKKKLKAKRSREERPIVTIR